MIQGVQAIFAKEDLSDLASKLKGANIKQLVNPPEDAPTHRKFTNTNEVVYYPEERTQLLIAYSQRLHDLGRVRQRGLFSSFSLPADSSSSKVWNVIDLASPRSEFYREKLREERRILEKHARSSGCSLIINPFLDFRSVGASVHRAQLAELLFFIKSMEADELTVVISNTEFRGNLTIVGDWFGAKTPPPQPGVEYRQTVFCRHAATVFKWIQEFDQELNDSLVASKIEAVQSRDLAISRIEERLQELPLE